MSVKKRKKQGDVMKWESLQKFLVIEVNHWDGDNAEQLVDSLARQIRYHDRAEIKKEMGYIKLENKTIPGKFRLRYTPWFEEFWDRKLFEDRYVTNETKTHFSKTEIPEKKEAIACVIGQTEEGFERTEDLDRMGTDPVMSFFGSKII